MIEKIFRKLPLLRVYYKGFLNRTFQLLDKEDGVYVMEEDWDNLIVLDACRFDFFRKMNWIKGALKKKISLGSHTEEWMRKNFQNDYPDTVYISGNPQISEVKCRERFGRIPFYKIENVWDYGWNDEKNMLPPETVSKAAIEMKHKYPEKRLIIHYMQPHWPFPTHSRVSPANLKSKIRKSLPRGILWKVTHILSERFLGLRLALKKREKADGNIWDYMREGQVDPSKAKIAYRENIRMVLNDVEWLLNHLEGKSVITSDHGNLFGEHWIYGHPPRIHFKELVEVPWLEIEGSFDKSEGRVSEKRRITSKVEELKENGMV